MLPSALLLFRSRGDHVVPRYLLTSDEAWIDTLIAACEAHVGRTVLERRSALNRVARMIVEQHAIAENVVEGVRYVLEREYRTEVAAPRPPAELRMIVFEEAARGDAPDYDGALLRASEQLELPVALLLESLFADRTSARRVLPAQRAVTPAAIIEAYDLALVETILLRSEAVTVQSRDHVRAIARFARRAGLICTFSGCESGGRFEVSGPLALLRSTTRYGHALFKFFGALATTPHYHLEARCAVDGQRVLVRIAEPERRFGGATLGSMMWDVDTPVERALGKDLARMDREWRFRRCSEGTAAMPDFELVRDGARVFVEVVADVGPEYLASRARALPANVVLCVDERIALPDLGNTRVLLYRRKVDPAALIEAAREVARPSAIQ